MRRVIVAVNSDGKSFVVSDENIDPGRIWTFSPNDVRGWSDQISDSEILLRAQPPAGGALWAMVEMEPHTEALGTTPGETAPGMDDKGFHVTKTVDFVYVLRGTLTLDLDLERVTLSAGDAAVLQAANHAWHNRTDAKVIFLDSVISVP